MATQDTFLERFRRWATGFYRGLSQSPADVRRTWARLGEKGSNFESDAAFLLFGYAGGFDSQLAAFRRRNKQLARRAEATIRALRVSHTRSPKKSTDPRLFERRAEEHLTGLYGSQLPFQEGPFDESLSLASQELGISVVESLLVIPGVIRKMSGPRSLVTRLIFLYFLRERARECGVRLGVKRLASLADCAAPNAGQLDPSSLARYFRRAEFEIRASARNDLAGFVRGKCSLK